MADMHEQTDRYFDWHGLPAELQDLCFDFCVGDELSYRKPDYEAYISVKDYPLWNISAVSRAMKQQYEKRVQHRTTLIFSDHENFSFSLLPIPPKVSGVRRAEIRMFVVCESLCPNDQDDCQASNDLRQTVSLVDKITSQLPNLETFNLLLGLWWKDDGKISWPATPHHARLSEAILKLSEIPKLGNAAVFRSEERCLDATKLVDESKLLVSWSKGRGEWEVAEPAHSVVAVSSSEPIDTTKVSTTESIPDQSALSESATQSDKAAP